MLSILPRKEQLSCRSREGRAAACVPRRRADPRLAHPGRQPPLTSWQAERHPGPSKAPRASLMRSSWVLGRLPVSTFILSYIRPCFFQRSVWRQMGLSRFPLLRSNPVFPRMTPKCHFCLPFGQKCKGSDRRNPLLKDRRKRTPPGWRALQSASQPCIGITFAKLLIGSETVGVICKRGSSYHPHEVTWGK